MFSDNPLDYLQSIHLGEEKLHQLALIFFFALYEDDGFEGFVGVFVVALSIEQLKLFLWDW
jgi:hypothetical protein